jgi:hypothetical protein
MFPVRVYSSGRLASSRLKSLPFPRIFCSGFPSLSQRGTLAFHPASSGTSVFSRQHVLPRGHHGAGGLGFAGRALLNR